SESIGANLGLSSPGPRDGRRQALHLALHDDRLKLSGKAVQVVQVMPCAGNLRPGGGAGGGVRFRDRRESPLRDSPTLTVSRRSRSNANHRDARRFACAGRRSVARWRRPSRAVTHAPRIKSLTRWAFEVYL